MSDDEQEKAKRRVEEMDANDMFVPKRGYARLRPPYEQGALVLAEKVLAKHDNDLAAAVREWQQHFRDQPEMVRAMCDAFFYRAAVEIEARIRRHDADEPGKPE